MVVVDTGFNIFFKGHENKLTLGYQNRPVFQSQNNGAIKESERKAYVVMQYQLVIN
jgi:hypothetical protein